MATWVEVLARTQAAPAAKQKLAAIQHLIDWMVTGQVMEEYLTAGVEQIGILDGPKGDYFARSTARRS